MKIFIPVHLRKIKVVEQLWQMLQTYYEGFDEDGKSYYTKDVESFDYYKSMLKLDPVKRFLCLCIPEDSIQEDLDYDAIIDYLACKFYSVKGTAKVIELMKKHLTSINIGENFEYTTKSLTITIDSLETADQTMFLESLKDFLNALLYFSNYESECGTIRLVLSDEILRKMGYFAIPYEQNIATEL